MCIDIGHFAYYKQTALFELKETSLLLSTGEGRKPDWSVKNSDMF